MRRLVWLGLIHVIATVLVAMLSLRLVDVAAESRPVVSTFAVWTAQGAVWLAAVVVAVRRDWSGWSLAALCLPAFLGRAILLPTAPILEIDIYRYVWDGNAIEAGVSPYRYSPQVVRFARDFGTADTTLGELASKASEPGLRDVVDAVHFGDLTTPYPPVSQAVFALGASLTPDDASAMTHLLTLKALLLVFDFGTLGLLVLLLRVVGVSTGWVVAYGWSPLVLKECANSGHLDVIAVFFSVGAVLALCKGARGESHGGVVTWSMLSALLIGLGVGAKLYPVVLAPLFVVFTLRTAGLQTAVISGVTGLVVSSVCLLPMAAQSLGPAEVPEADGEILAADGGLTTFLRQWEMNDLLFAVVVENLKTDDERAGQIEPWFSVAPDSLRLSLLDASRAVADFERDQPYLLARGISAAAYGAVVVIACVSVWRGPTVPVFARWVFLTVAWLWLLAPTQNPWYWMWAMPFVSFAKSRVWLLLGPLAMVYYTRFWFETSGVSITFLGQSYAGVDGFDFLVVWLEYLPFWIALTGAPLARRTLAAKW